MATCKGGDAPASRQSRLHLSIPEDDRFNIGILPADIRVTADPSRECVIIQVSSREASQDDMELLLSPASAVDVGLAPGRSAAPAEPGRRAMSDDQLDQIDAITSKIETALGMLVEQCDGAGARLHYLVDRLEEHVAELRAAIGEAMAGN